MALLDYCKVFDCVWNESFLTIASHEGLQVDLTLWPRGFLSNRQAKAQTNDNSVRVSYLPNVKRTAMNIKPKDVQKSTPRACSVSYQNLYGEHFQIELIINFKILQNHLYLPLCFNS